MDVYCHPFTSGGQEIPIQEAKLTSLITLVTNYSCGEEMCCPEAASLPLEWNEYREFGTEFIKASTCPKSIAKNLEIVLNMDQSQKQKMGRSARKWAIDNFSSQHVGGKIEKFLDSCNFSNYSLDQDQSQKGNPDAEIPNIQNDILWLKTLYSNILNRIVKDDDEGLVHWVEKIKSGISRLSIESYFREVARKQQPESKSFTFNDLFKDSKKEDRIFISISSSKENAFLSTKIISSIKEQNLNKKIYLYTSHDTAEIFFGNSDISEILVQGKEFNDVDFLKKNFCLIYSLDNFSINNYHSILMS